MDRQPAKKFEDLLVWQKAHAFVLKAYPFSSKFPKDELFGLVSQLRRAAVSIPANIVEGFRRRTQADKARFLNIAQSSLEEVRYYLLLAHDLGYGNSAALQADLSEVSRILEAYTRAVLSRRPSNS
ncbi:MAG TPA: four helix bundle protein [Pirellulales bacterium]|nr:four helix bundle protein [Pirellulales bacterium]